MLKFFIGLIVGLSLGIMLMCLLQINRDNDDKEEFTSRKILELRGDEEWKKI